MTTNQTRASSLSYNFDKLFPEVLPSSYHSPEAKLPGAAESLENKGLQCGNQGLTKYDPNLSFQNYISFLTYTKFVSATVILYTFPFTSPDPYLG